jgi:AraC family transcriptional regulator
MAQSPPINRSSTTSDQKYVFNPDWEVHGLRELCSGGLVVRHDIETPDEIELPAIDRHLLLLSLTGAISRFCGEAHEGDTAMGYSGLLPAGEPGFFSWESTDEAVAFIIDPQLLAKTAIELDCIGSSNLELKPILAQADPTIHALGLQFKQEMQRHALGGELYSESLANLLNIHLLRNCCTTQPVLRTYSGGLSAQRLQQTIDYIQAHLDEKLSLETIAAELNLSTYYFCELFTQSMGMPPYKYVLHQRVDRAKQILKHSEKSLTDIALDCGFANQSHLTRHFKKYTGVTPSRYRAD